MSSTNKTAYYDLSQFVGTDIPNPLTDYNGDMSKIDTTLHEMGESVAEDKADVTALGNRVGVVEGNVNTLTTQAGSDALTTEAQTLSGAVNEIKAEADTNKNDIATLNTAIYSKADSSTVTALTTRVTNAETKIGSATLETTSKNLSGAVNELKGRVDAIPTSTPSASNVSYSNTTSGLSATNVQSAIDELAQGGTGSSASDITYDNSSSGLTATNVQSAIDEVANVHHLKFDNITISITTQSGQIYLGSYDIPYNTLGLTTKPSFIQATFFGASAAVNDMAFTAVEADTTALHVVLMRGTSKSVTGTLCFTIIE